MRTVIQNGKVAEAYLSKKEMKAFVIISEYKSMGLPPTHLHKRLKELGLTAQMGAGTKAYNWSKGGAEIFESGGYSEPNPKDPNTWTFPKNLDRDSVD